jgi:hypothetical protein
MPRVTSKTKSTRGKTYNCTKCGAPITVGQRFYQWARRFGRSGVTYRRHMDCGFPKPSELSSAKTAVIEDALQDLSLSSWNPQVPEEWDGNVESIDIDHSEITDALQGIADTAREVGSEYEDGVSNMPEGLQQGPTGEAMQEIAQELESWADDLESFDPQVDAPDWPERFESEDDDTWRGRVEDALDTWVADVISEAEDKLGEMPTYQG